MPIIPILFFVARRGIFGNSSILIPTSRSRVTPDGHGPSGVMHGIVWFLSHTLPLSSRNLRSKYPGPSPVAGPEFLGPG